MARLTIGNGRCVFCKKFSDAYMTEDEIAVFEPLNPVVPGHTLVVPAKHVVDFITDPDISARTMERAALVAKRLENRVFMNALKEEKTVDPSTFGMNLITSAGTAATQSVMHLHIHLIPRRTGDGLHLPWTGQNEPRD